ncbi:hypothetical protein [Endozoicomonas numazuensis]|uniref:Uncharacterized protein n=1 Tax=Endozoicomonas numazuensis TaxID=1137799 RepID=A0A081NGH5_9GAMM|nr:hypothetical protein [Endozoicomonas numazuensis]KEQ17548.1 hypothetical protein GZ78_17540 [Endozoicomonas numazuensis]
MNPLPKSVSTSQGLRLEGDESEKHKASAVKPFIQKEAGFSVASEPKTRIISSLSSEQSVFSLQKAALEQTGRKYFSENLPLILTQA